MEKLIEFQTDDLVLASALVNNGYVISRISLDDGKPSRWNWHFDHCNMDVVDHIRCRKERQEVYGFLQRTKQLIGLAKRFEESRRQYTK